MEQKPKQTPQTKTSGMFYKAAQIAKNVIERDEMDLINKYTLSPLEPENIFSFKVTMCANEVDRDYEVFPIKTLEKLSELFIGKTVVKDHVHKSDNQIARIYQTYLKEDVTSITPTGEPYTQLIAKCYMIKTASNADLIAEINAGIRKEVSLGCRITKATCSICEKDNAQEYCSHFPGQTYDGETCFFKLEEPKDAYELSFVAIPAQKEAGTVKKYGEKPLYLKSEESEENTTPSKNAEQTEESAGEQKVETEIESGIEEQTPEESPIRLHSMHDDTHNLLSEIVKASVMKEQSMSELCHTVKSLVTKMDEFINAVVENTREIRSSETADFSDVLALAEKLENIADNQGQEQLSTEMQKDAAEYIDEDVVEKREELHISAEETTENTEEAAETAEGNSLEEKSLTSDNSVENEAEQISESNHKTHPEKESEDEIPSTGESQSFLEEESNEYQPSSDSEELLDTEQDKEKLAFARLRSLDLSINLLSK